jgi:hypothetical protein
LCIIPVALTETDADRFRHKRRRSAALAASATTVPDKEAWLRLAADWIKLAETPSRGGDVGWAKSTATSVGASFFQNLILKGYAIVFLEPGFRGVRGGEDSGSPTCLLVLT